MKPFSKRKTSVCKHTRNLVSIGMQAGYKYLQSSWAKWMMKHTENFSRRTWIVILILFVLSTGAYSIYLAVGSFTKKGTRAITIISISRPEHTRETGEIRIEAVQMSETTYRHIKRFSLYMDSLAGSPSGKALYDSITNYRPGLMDSVRFIENYYKQLK